MLCMYIKCFYHTNYVAKKCLYYFCFLTTLPNKCIVGSVFIGNYTLGVAFGWFCNLIHPLIDDAMLSSFIS